MFGWDPRPSIEQVVGWVGYLVPVTYLFLRRGKSASPAATPAAPAVGATSLVDA
jgi:high-affinity iron transporter